jgi:hypothetical protein
MTAGAASLKRKRDIDDDVDLYGDGEATDKVDDDVDETIETNVALEVQTGIVPTEETEWLIFLVSQEGELQVLILCFN